MGKPIITEIDADEITHAEIKIEETGEVTTVPSEEREFDQEKPTEVDVGQKKVIKKKKIIKKKKTVTTGDDGIPKVVEEITEEEIPEIHEISIRDEAETTIEGIVKPIISEIDADEITHAEIKIEETEEVTTVPSEERDVDQEKPTEADERQKKVIKKKRIIKKKKTVTTGDDGIPKV